MTRDGCLQRDSLAHGSQKVPAKDGIGCSRLSPSCPLPWSPGIHKSSAGITAWCWTADRPAGPRGTRRTARTTRPRAGQRRTAGRQATRPLPGHACVNGLTARLRGQERAAGVHGHAGARARVVAWATAGAVTWRTRRGGTRRSVRWARVTPRLPANPSARPRLTAVGRRRGCA